MNFLRIRLYMVMGILFSAILVHAKSNQAQDAQKNKLMNVQSQNSSIQVEMRYFTTWNFIGQVIDGYQGNTCLLLPKAAKALSKVQKDLNKKGYSLLVFDCYRPQRAVNMFVQWAEDLNDNKMKPIYYPDIPKNKLFELGYIASKSGHSRGSTVDLTVIKLENIIHTDTPLRYQESKEDCRLENRKSMGGQVNMGGTYDCFSPVSHTDNRTISETAQKNRRLLKDSMEKHGFVNYDKEWWHYTLKNEPNKNNYYDGLVE